MGRQVSGANSRFGTLDFVFHEIRNAARNCGKMKILALELSTACGSLACLSEGVDLAREWPNERKNSGAFFANLGDMQKQFGRSERIIVGLGPGSYAGTRIAISAAIGLQLATGSELIGLPSICAIDCAAVE